MGAFIIYTCGILPLRVAFGDNSFGFFSMIDLLIDMSLTLSDRLPESRFAAARTC